MKLRQLKVAVIGPTTSANVGQALTDFLDELADTDERDAELVGEPQVVPSGANFYVAVFYA